MAEVTLRSALREAVATLLALLATLACAWRLDPTSGAVVLGAVLCLSLSRSQLDRDLRGRLEALWAMPLLGLVAAGIALLLFRQPWLGALAFTLGMAGSIWLRRFGPAARRAGSLIAAPMVAILTTPYVPPNPALPIPPLLLPIVIGLLALLWVTVVHLLFRACGWLPPAKDEDEAPAAATRESKLRPSATTRMALQMALALALAFTLGYAFFGPHWPWPVLTAFIVNAGNRGRLDVLHKSLLRMAGAAAGTLAAALIPAQLFAHDTATIALILAALFVAIWLRPLGYAWWALFVTLVLALLQDYLGAPSESALVLRLAGIAAGAAIGVAAAWFVLPVRSDNVLRLRMATALAALQAALDPAQPQRDARVFLQGLKAVDELAPAFRSGGLLARVLHLRLASADWVEQLLACREDAMRLIDSGRTPPAVRLAVGAARKALLEPAQLPDALRALRNALAEAVNSP